MSMLMWVLVLFCGGAVVFTLVAPKEWVVKVSEMISVQKNWEKLKKLFGK